MLIYQERARLIPCPSITAHASDVHNAIPYLLHEVGEADAQLVGQQVERLAESLKGDLLGILQGERVKGSRCRTTGIKVLELGQVTEVVSECSLEPQWML